MARGVTPTHEELMQIPLETWLRNLRARHATITIRPDGTPTTRPFAPTDRDHLTRYRHALRVAANGTHTAWWDHITGRAPMPTGIDSIPSVHHPTSTDGLAFACATCGQPADTLDRNLLAWCHDHS